MYDWKLDKDKEWGRNEKSLVGKDKIGLWCCVNTCLV